MCSCLFVSSCSAKPSLPEENVIEDKYDNYYEIFVYSYSDSNGDGIGDLNGVTQKLDYIRDMGYTGIWLMPIHPSSSYHKYDVSDYYSVDKSYGTMEDYDALVEKAHSLGIKVIIDLVVNHTSSSNLWFLKAVSAAKKGDTEAPYYDFYNFSTKPQSGYSMYGTSGVYYECRFDKGMPDLNLDSENVRREISDIIGYWTSHGTDGFRLDACTSYYTENMPKSIEFCGWLQNEAKKYNSDAYLVGEVWSSENIIANYYTSGMDSFFGFQASQADGFINGTFLSSSPADSFWRGIERTNAMVGQYISAPFLCNHDTGRIAGIAGRKEEKIKFEYGLLSTLTGSTFTYYGDEIGMIGSGVDPNKRIAMLWDNSKVGLTMSPPGCTVNEYIFDGVKEQQADESSILNYYKTCNRVRNAYPSIMRGTSERIGYEDSQVLIMKKSYRDETVTIVINFSEEEKNVAFSEGKLQASICVSSNVTQKGKSLVMPGYSIAILK